MFNRSKPTRSTGDKSLSQLSWEASIVDSERRAARMAWKFAVVGLLIGLLGIACAITVLPLKTTEIRVVTVDKLTGETGLASTVGAYATTPNELNDKYWTKRFLLARERYNYKLLQSDYDTVRLLAADKPWRAYASQFEGSESLEKKYAQDIEITPTVLSTTISQYGIATVRYEVKERDYRSSDALAKIERRVATLRYRYAPHTSASERDLIDNPLGFTVDAYQSVLELASVTPIKSATPSSGSSSASVLTAPTASALTPSPVPGKPLPGKAPQLP
jgi:type IV secretion system protein VirB8